MRNIAAAALVAGLLTASALAAVPPYPASFGTMNIPVNSTQIYVRVGGSGPAVVLLHGFGETGDMWAPLAAELVRDHFMIVPDLRGMGLSSRPAGGYDKKTQAQDVAGVLDALKIDKADSCDPRYRQHGRLCLCRPTSGTGEEVCPHRCAVAGDWSVGRYRSQPCAVAFFILRS